eukprot:scaffold31639_cov199-Amphora_coffeaeformis.AAC.1
MSLYGEQRAANLWYNKIRKSLVDELGFKVSDFDPCLFIRKDCLLCLYVDDAILHAREDKTLDEVLNTIAQCLSSSTLKAHFILLRSLQSSNPKISQITATFFVLEV